mgnify:CR=1 FL=1
MRGISDKERKPSKKDHGFLSIEKKSIGLENGQSSGEIVYMVFRNFLGATLFTGFINSKISKIKNMPSDKAEKFLAKVALGCIDSETKKIGVEYCVIHFVNEDDRR